VPSGKEAITHYEVLETYLNQVSLVKVKLETGRTHQIRVHMSELGHPVLGDKTYGIKRQQRAITNQKLQKLIKSSLHRQALHAAELGFKHPRTGEPLLFKWDWPEDISPFISELKKLK
jgi:23S rRNA pseudouridine1911/1915/1917 synthase